MSKEVRQGGLGRGLGSLIPTDGSESKGAMREIPVCEIVPNTYQPRRAFDEDELDALATSIADLGVLQPVLVRRRGAGFELIAGERRWRAATRAGLERIPAIVRDVDDETSLAHAIVENIQRSELNAIEEAAAFQQLIDEFSLTQEEVASRVGRSRPAIANSLRLLQLPVTVQSHIIAGRLSAGHGRVLVSLSDQSRDQLLEKVLHESLSVRALELLARDNALGESEGAVAKGDPDSVGRTKPPALLELEQRLGDWFDTQVVINLGPTKGKLSIDFADIDDLERIYGIIIKSF